MALKNALEKLDNAIQDLLSLHVQTYSGTVNFEGQNIENFDNLRKAIHAAAKGDVEGQINAELKLETLIQFDGDSYNFVATGADDALLTMHKDAVAAGIETRQGLLDLFKGVIKG